MSMDGRTAVGGQQAGAVDVSGRSTPKYRLWSRRAGTAALRHRQTPHLPVVDSWAAPSSSVPDDSAGGWRCYVPRHAITTACWRWTRIRARRFGSSRLCIGLRRAAFPIGREMGSIRLRWYSGPSVRRAVCAPV